MTNSPPWLERLLRWASVEEHEGPEGPEDPERREFVEYLEYIEAHGHMEFGAYRFMRWRERADKGLEPEHTLHHPEPPTPPPPPSRRSHRPGRLRRQLGLYRVLSVGVALVLLGVFLTVALNLPAFGDPNAPALNEVAQRYLEQGVAETGAINAVTGLILEYRAFDTFGESAVLFAAAVSVRLLLGKPGRRVPTYRSPDPIFVLLGRWLLPLIALFGGYVIVNGHLSPGGGFSGGAILGGGLILASLVLGEEELERRLPLDTLSRVSTLALLAYGLMKGFSFFTGGNHLPWDIPKGTPGEILSGGLILPLNLCVGVIVACTLYSFYLLFLPGEE